MFYHEVSTINITTLLLLILNVIFFFGDDTINDL